MVLLLVAVDLGLGGVVIVGCWGIVKFVMVRVIYFFLFFIEIVKGFISNCNFNYFEEWDE